MTVISPRAGLVIVILLICFVIFSVMNSPGGESNVNNQKNEALSSPPPKTTSQDGDDNSPAASPPKSSNDQNSPSSSKITNKINNNSKNLFPDFADELFNITGQSEKIPPFLARPAKRGNDLKIRWKCTPRKIGPFHVDAPTTPWPTCRMLDHDTDMKTFQYFTQRLMCGLPVFGSQSEKWVHAAQKVLSGGGGGEGTAPITATGTDFNEILKTYNKIEMDGKQVEDDDASMKSHRPLRVLQVGANTGSNLNDPLVKMLMGGFAQAVLLEPVPWIFDKLHETYGSMAGMVALVQAAVSNKDGSTSFMAPKASMGAKGPWLHQMGGLNLPPRSVARLKRMGLMKEFKQITVASLTITTVLNKFAPWVVKDEHGGLPPPPDVVVIDAEGFDAVIVNQVLDYVNLLDEAGRANEDGETVSIIQYENKHVNKKDNARLMARLVKMGYSVTEVYVDTVAVRTGRGAFYASVKEGAASPRELEKRWPACDHGFSLERR